jgi:hypothetical protein
MAKAFVPKIVSANDLMEGDVVYLAAGHVWSRNIADALIASDEHEAEALLHKGEARQDLIVGAYLLDVAIAEDGTPSPTHFREKYRLNGPSIDYLAPQKQDFAGTALQGAPSESV